MFSFFQIPRARTPRAQTRTGSSAVRSDKGSALRYESSYGRDTDGEGCKVRLLRNHNALPAQTVLSCKIDTVSSRVGNKLFLFGFIPRPHGFVHQTRGHTAAGAPAPSPPPTHYARTCTLTLPGESLSTRSASARSFQNTKNHRARSKNNWI